jgi:hypothetical protein
MRQVLDTDPVGDHIGMELPRARAEFWGMEESPRPACPAQE